MDAYIFQAAFYCEDCAVEIKDNLKVMGLDPADFEDEYTYDSNEYPKGSYSDGGGESDIPAHCDNCNVFLENPLTLDGYYYVQEALEEAKVINDTLQTWRDYYGFSWTTNQVDL